MGRFKSPTIGFTKIFYVPQTFEHVNDIAVCRKYRNVSSSAAADAGIVIGGRIGTMNEFTLLYDLGKIIGVFDGSGGITERVIWDLLADAKKASKAVIIRDSDPYLL